MDIEKILLEVSSISKKYELLNQKTGSYFNIFDIANIATDEVKICRVIYELINTKGSHYQGFTYLKLFVKYVLDLENEISEDDYKDIKVYREYIIENDRRIDLVIETKDKFIPIEVKIFAGDQDKQCYDYFKKAKNSNMYYLTLDGKPPSKESASGLTLVESRNGCVESFKEVTQISFANHILVWLEKCVETQETIRVAPIREILLQLIAIIRKLTNQIGACEEMEIIDVISASSENFKSAEKIVNSINKTKTEMLKNVLSELEKKVDAIAKKKGFKKEINYLYYNQKGTADSYYNNQRTTYPGINYYCTNLTCEVDLWFRVEIDNRIFAGFYAFNNKKNVAIEIDMLIEEEIKKYLDQKEVILDNCWANWRPLPNGVNDNCPNFKNFNEAYYNLYDDIKFDAFINKCEQYIDSILQ